MAGQESNVRHLSAPLGSCCITISWRWETSRCNIRVRLLFSLLWNRAGIFRWDWHWHHPKNMREFRGVWVDGSCCCFCFCWLSWWCWLETSQLKEEGAVCPVTATAVPQPWSSMLPHWEKAGLSVPLRLSFHLVSWDGSLNIGSFNRSRFL